MAQLDLTALVGGSPLTGLARLGEHRGELAGIEMTLVEQHLGASGNRRHDARLARGAADRADAALVAEPDLADRERGLGGGREAVATQLHRGRARMRGLAAEDRHVALDAAGAEHGRGGLAAALEDRPLLDVKLQVGAGAAQLLARFVHALELHAVAGDDVLEALAVAVAQVAHLVDLERAGARGRAEQAAPEAGALLVRPVHEPQPHRRAAIGVRAQRADGAEDAERAVEPAAGRHRVDVRADDHEVVAVARQVSPEVAGGVDLDLHRQLLEARAQELARLHPLVRPADAPRAVGPAGQAGQLAQVREHEVGVHRRHEATAAGARSERGMKRPWPGSVRISPRS